MNRHLVAVEVGVECRANERMKLYRSALYEHGLERLNGKSVERGSTVEKHGMVLYYRFECIPYLGTCLLHLFLCVLDIGGALRLDEALHNERLEELESHFLRKSALINLQRRTYDDNGTSGIVDTLTEQVLTEASLLTAEHLGKRLERTVAGAACYGLAASAVIDEGVYRLLKHTLFVSDDYFRCKKLCELLETVVSVDNSAIEIVYIRRRKSAAVQLYHRADIRRDNGNDIEYHPLGAVAGLSECLDNLKPLDNAKLFLTACRGKFSLELLGKLLYIYFAEELFHSLGTHAYAEIILVFLIHFAVFALGKELHLLEGRIAGVENDVLREIEYLFKEPRRKVEKQTYTGRYSAEIPYMRYRSGKLDMTHSLAAHFLGCNLNAAFFADLALIADSLVFSAETLPVLSRTEDFLAEKTVLFGAKRSVVYGLGLGDLAA